LGRLRFVRRRFRWVKSVEVEWDRRATACASSAARRYPIAAAFGAWTNAALSVARRWSEKEEPTIEKPWSARAASRSVQRCSRGTE
jgi:hypothetical protein